MPLDLAIHEHALPYVEQLVERRIEDIDLVVVHCTELPDLATARSYGERILYADTGTGASGHYYIDRDGRIERYVPPARAANHTRGYNPRSVGIEIVNTGCVPDDYKTGYSSGYNERAQVELDRRYPGLTPEKLWQEAEDSLASE